VHHVSGGEIFLRLPPSDPVRPNAHVSALVSHCLAPHPEPDLTLSRRNEELIDAAAEKQRLKDASLQAVSYCNSEPFAAGDYMLNDAEWGQHNCYTEKAH